MLFHSSNVTCALISEPVGVIIPGPVLALGSSAILYVAIIG